MILHVLTMFKLLDLGALWHAYGSKTRHLSSLSGDCPACVACRPPYLLFAMLSALFCIPGFAVLPFSEVNICLLICCSNVEMV